MTQTDDALPEEQTELTEAEQIVGLVKGFNSLNDALHISVNLQQFLNDNLTATQERCNQLLEENRRLKKCIEKLEAQWVKLLDPEPDDPHPVPGDGT